MVKSRSLTKSLGRLLECRLLFLMTRAFEVEIEYHNRIRGIIDPDIQKLSFLITSQQSAR